MSLDDSMTDLEDDGQRLFARVNASKLPFHVESIIVSFILIVPLDEQKGAGRKMDLKLELVPVPVSDVDRAKAFYVEKVGFHADHDVQPGNGMRVVQLTPPGSACSIVIGTGMGEISEMQPGTVKGLHLVVADINKAREAFGLRGVDVGEVDDLGGVKYVHFSDPDGNSWVLQEMPVHQ
jgi:catechol 2,3-dioxygenase-like lactoylglutathione lyase family enzyme